MKKITILALLWMLVTAINALAQNNQTTINNAQGGDIFYHTVERGQTVYSIAKMYEVKVEDIYKLNIGSAESIKAGNRLKIPQKNVTAKEEVKSESNGAYIYHTIQAGETPYGVARRYHVKGEYIIEANPGLSQETFSAGKTIRIPITIKNTQTAEIVENQRGDREIFYTVPAKETIYNICRKFRTTEKELLKLNPELSGGLRRGMTLRIPLRINEKDLPKETEPNANEVNAMLKTKKEVKLANAAKIALLLPFDTKNPNSTDLKKRIIEYYEGMLLAADTLRKQGYSIDPLLVYEIGDASNTKKLLQQKSEELKKSDLIIGGVSDEQIKLIADFAKTNKIKYVVPFSRNDEVLDNAYIFQVNTPQTHLHANAAYAGANLFAKHNIIFLDTKDKEEQVDFIKEFKQELKDRNISYKDVVYSAENFEKDILSHLSTSKPNMIMPISHSLDALTKIKTVLRTIAETKPEYKFNLFGYPVWQTSLYTKECLDDFHVLDTYIYSLFYADNINPSVKTFYDNYKNWYSKDPIPMFPKYAMIGYDTGMLFFSALQNYGVNFENKLSEVRYKSIQTGFNFERVNNWGGFINTNLYIIHYGKDYSIKRSDFR